MYTSIRIRNFEIRYRLHESTAHELEHLFPRLVTGGVLIIDDYGHWEGARKAAFDEYLAKYNVAYSKQDRLHRKNSCQNLI